MNLPYLRRRRPRVLRSSHRPDFLPFLLGSAAGLFLPIATAVAQAPPVDSSRPASLEELADRFQNAEAPVRKKAQDLLAIVDSEVGANRIPEPIAQGLRWTLHNLASTGDVLVLLTSTRLPLENAAIMEAALSLYDSERAAQAERSALKAQGIREAGRRSTELVRSGGSVAEIDAFLPVIERFQKLTEKYPHGIATRIPASDFSTCIPMLRSLRSVMAIPLAGDSAEARSAVGQFRQDESQALEFVSSADYGARAAGIVALFQQATDTARDNLGSALIAGEPYEKTRMLAGKFVDATRRFSDVAQILIPEFSNFGFTDYQTASRAYPQIDNFSQLIASHQWSKAEAEIAAARQCLPQMAARQAAALEALLKKLELRIPHAPETPAQEFYKELRAKLDAVKQPSDLAATAADPFNSRRESLQSEDPEIAQRLATQLSALATAWSVGDPNLLSPWNLQEDRMEDAGLVALRNRIKREIAGRLLGAPEFTQAPYASQPLGAAFDGFLAKLAAEGQWPRVLEVLKTKSTLLPSPGANPENSEMVSAVRSYLTGKNFEAAGLWTEAAAAYKSVLATATDHTPVTAAADRLKALAKEHPESLKADWIRPRPVLLE